MWFPFPTDSPRSSIRIPRSRVPLVEPVIRLATNDDHYEAYVAVVVGGDGMGI